MAWAEKRSNNTWRVRYERPDGTLGSVPGFENKTAADTYARNLETDTSRGQFREPRTRMTLGDWVEVWSKAHHASDNTWAKYHSHLKNHILPAFAQQHLDDITRIAVKRWVTSLRKKLAHATLLDVVTLLSMILGEAVEEDLITTSPCRKLRLGTETRRPYPTATPAQIEHIAARCAPAEALMIRTAAYTGLRFSELAALHWHNLDLHHGTLTIDPDTGALHDIAGHLTLGPPKTPASARTLHLPPGLTTALREHSTQHHHEHVFTSEHGDLLRRTNFRNRVWNPAVTGHTRHDWQPILDGLTFHGLRHTHKTWMIEDGIPEVLQHQRLGHRMHGVTGIYSHPTQPMTTHMLDALQSRWNSTHTHPTQDTNQAAIPAS